jgi:hypothetical protein
MTTAISKTRDFATNIHIATKSFQYNTIHKPMTRILFGPAYYVCKVDYPFNNGFIKKVWVTQRGLTLKGFVTLLCNAYKKHYDAIHNNKVDDGYFHGIGDLYLERIMINDEAKTIEIWIGS